MQKEGCHGRMHEDARVASAETDGVGLRLCLKVPIGMSRFQVPFPTPEQVHAKAAAQGKPRGRGKKK
jgi:hypothetical protein